MPYPDYLVKLAGSAELDNNRVGKKGKGDHQGHKRRKMLASEQDHLSRMTKALNATADAQRAVGLFPCGYQCSDTQSWCCFVFSTKAGLEKHQQVTAYCYGVIVTVTLVTVCNRVRLRLIHCTGQLKRASVRGMALAQKESLLLWRHDMGQASPAPSHRGAARLRWIPRNAVLRSKSRKQLPRSGVLVVPSVILHRNNPTRRRTSWYGNCIVIIVHVIGIVSAIVIALLLLQHYY